MRAVGAARTMALLHEIESLKEALTANACKAGTLQIMGFASVFHHDSSKRRFEIDCVAVMLPFELASLT